MSKIDQIKIPVTIDEFGNITMDELFGSMLAPPAEWHPTVKLVRSDGLTKRGDKFGFVEWTGSELGSSFKKLHTVAQPGFSCIIDPHRMSYTWLTSGITEVVSDEETDTQRCIAFRTKNSDYTLYIEKQ
jgi:hypothetical protein